MAPSARRTRCSSPSSRCLAPLGAGQGAASSSSSPVAVGPAVLATEWVGAAERERADSRATGAGSGACPGPSEGTPGGTAGSPAAPPPLAPAGLLGGAPPLGAAGRGGVEAAAEEADGEQGSDEQADEGQAACCCCGGGHRTRLAADTVAQCTAASYAPAPWSISSVPAQAQQAQVQQADASL